MSTLAWIVIVVAFVVVGGGGIAWKKRKGKRGPPHTVPTPLNTISTPTTSAPRLWEVEINFTITNLLIFGVVIILWVTGNPDSSWSWGWFVFFLQIFWVLASFKQIGPDEIGVRLFFGKPIDQIGPGLVFVPIGFVQLRKLPTTDIPVEIPAEPEKVDKGNQDNPMEGKVPPIRIVQPSWKEAKYFDDKGKLTLTFDQLSPKRKAAIKEDPLSRGITTEINVRLIYYIEGGIPYIKHIGGEDPSAVRERTKDAITATLQSVLSKVTPREALAHKDLISKLVLKSVEKLVGEKQKGGKPNNQWWGINIRATEVMQIDPGETINREMAKAAAANFVRQKTVEDAKATKAALTLEGQGEGAKRKSIHLGESEGLAAKALIASTAAGLEVSRLETVRAALSSGNHTTVVAGSSLEGAVLGTIEAALKRSATPTPPPAPAPKAPPTKSP